MRRTEKNLTTSEENYEDRWGKVRKVRKRDEEDFGKCEESYEDR